MSTGLSLATEVLVLPCPRCNQTINTSMQQCPFCHSPLDPNAALAFAAAFSKVNAAVSDASYLKIMGGVAITFCVLRLIPFLSLIGVAGFYFLLLAIPFMSIRWWLKYNALPTNDPEYAKARRTAIWFGVGSLVVLFLVLTVRIIF